MYGVDMVENSGAPDWCKFFFNLNPMTPIIKIYRQILYYKEVPHLQTLCFALVMGIVFIIVGELLFHKLQKGFAENF
jgi:ABC-2 type transport system permease protein